MNGCNFQRLLLFQRRQQPGQAAGQQGLAGAWRAGEQQVVGAGRGDQQSALGCRLPLNLGEVGVGQHLAQQPLRLEGLDRGRSVEVRGDLEQVIRGVDHQTGRQAGFLRIGPGHQQCASGFARRQGSGQYTLHRTQRSGERQLAEAFETLQTVTRDLRTGGKNAQGDREIEATAVFRQIGRGEIERDATGGKIEAGGQNRAAHTVLAFLDGGFRQADQSERGQAVGQMRLDRDGRRLHTDLSAAVDDCKGHSITPLIVASGLLRGWR